MPSHYTVKYTDFGPRYKFETFEEERARHEREYREKYLRVRQTEQQDLIEDLQKKLNKLTAWHNWIVWVKEWRSQYDRYISCLRIENSNKTSQPSNQLKVAEKMKEKYYKQVIDTLRFLQASYEDNVNLLKKEAKFKNDNIYKFYYNQVGSRSDMTLTAFRNTEASRQIAKLYIENISQAQDILQLAKRTTSDFYITNAGQKGEDAVEYVLKWLRPYGYMPVEKTCLTKYGTISILLQNKSFINEAQEYDHIIVGKNGVFLIETKNYSGEITVEQLAANAQRDAILAVAGEGSCVIVGRCADHVLRNEQGLLRVFLTADHGDRIQRICRRDSVTAAEAEEKLQRMDRSRAAYYRFQCDQTWGAAANYDLCINVSRWGVDAAVETIVERCSRS